MHAHDEESGELESQADRPPGGLTRRQLLQGATAVLVCGLAPMSQTASIASHAISGNFPVAPGARKKRWPPPPPGVRKPRFRRNKKPAQAATQLAPGFYINPKSQVIHHVGPNGKVARVDKIKQNRLQPVRPDALVRLPRNNSRPRVNLAYASYALEQAALAKVQAKEYDQACQLLVAAIRHDMLLKHGTTQPPAFRLYDLLAGISLR
ncbi:MAG: hypothetical protein M3347_14635, partial [Armatimonadota bacterium]|nr:hypothetical protein [Armatimonadota bacterium]